VTATNADGSNSVESDQTEAVAAATSSAAPKNTAPPTISGTPKVGQTLTVDPGSWSGNPTSFAYQWQRCDADVAACSNLVGATGKTYGLPIADLGYRLRVVVTAHNAKGSATATSAITTVVAPVATITNHRPTVTILGVQFVGATVYARLPHLRRLAQEPRDHRDRLASREALLHPPLRHTRTTAAVRRLHATLAPTRPLPRPRQLHRHAAGNR